MIVYNPADNSIAVFQGDYSIQVESADDKQIVKVIGTSGQTQVLVVNEVGNMVDLARMIDNGLNMLRVDEDGDLAGYGVV